MPLYVAVHNPYVATLALKQKLRFASREQIADITEMLKAEGHDGAVLKYGNGTTELVAYDTKAVKSLDNSGQFGPTGDIHFSRSANSTTSPATSATPASSPFHNRMDKIVDTLIYNLRQSRPFEHGQHQIREDHQRGKKTGSGEGAGRRISIGWWGNRQNR